MKLPKGTKVYHQNKCYVVEISDDLAKELGLKPSDAPAVEKDKPKKSKGDK